MGCDHHDAHARVNDALVSWLAMTMRMVQAGRRCSAAAADAAAEVGSALIATRGRCLRIRRRIRGAPFLGLMEGEMSPSAQIFCRSVVFYLSDAESFRRTAVFISSDHALTASHIARPSAGRLLSGRPFSTNPVQLPWAFGVAATDHDSGLTLLRLSGPRLTVFARLRTLSSTGPVAAEAAAQEFALVTGGVALHSLFACSLPPRGINPRCERVRPAVANGRHCAYHLVSEPGDPGSALFNLDGELVGIHLGNWDWRFAPLPNFAGGRKSVQGHRDRQRIMAMGLDCVSADALHSVVGLARELEVKVNQSRCCTGGFAVFVTQAMVDALLRRLEPSLEV